MNPGIDGEPSLNLGVSEADDAVAGGLMVIDEPEVKIETPVDRPRSGKLWTVLMVLSLGAVASGLWFVTHSWLFDARTIRVMGTSHLSRVRVAQMSGVTRRTNILWLSTRGVERRLETDPWILAATVTRDLPSSLTISVTERVPMAIVAGGQRMLVATDGMVLGPAPGGVRLPVIRLAEPQVKAGVRIRLAAPMLAVVAGLPPSLRGIVQDVVVDGQGQVSLVLWGGVGVFFGDASEPLAKWTALEEMLAWAARNGIRAASIDVRAPRSPALLPVGAGRVLTPGATASSRDASTPGAPAPSPSGSSR